LAEDLGFVIGLDPQSLSGVDRSETFLQFVQEILVQEITSSSRRDGSGSIGLCRTLQGNR
jgi:hypothetical protein